METRFRHCVTLLLFFAASSLSAGPFGYDDDTWRRFEDAVMLVESNGRSDAVGDKGRAVGAFQIHKGVVEDLNRLGGRKYNTRHTHNSDDRLDEDLSKEMFRRWLKLWWTRKHGLSQPTFGQLAAMWNGGPNMRPRQGYVERVMGELERRRR